MKTLTVTEKSRVLVRFNHATPNVYCVTGDRRDTRSRVGVDQMFFPPRAVEGEKISKALGGGGGRHTCHLSQGGVQMADV